MDNLEEAEVPPNVRVKAFPRDRLDPDDKAVFALCPRAPERDACEELVNTCAESMRPVALLCGRIVDMRETLWPSSLRRVRPESPVVDLPHQRDARRVAWASPLDGAIAQSHLKFDLSEGRGC